MKINKFVKQPIVVEAIQYTGNNQDDIKAFMCDTKRYYHIHSDGIVIETKDGDMLCSINDWIIKETFPNKFYKREFYPCKPDIFEVTYEPVDTAHPDVTELQKELALYKKANGLMLNAFVSFYDDLLNREMFKVFMSDEIRHSVEEAKKFMTLETFIKQAQEAQ